MKKDYSREEFGQRVERLRKAKGIKQRDLSKALDKSVTYATKIESGELEKVSFKDAVTISKFLDVDLMYLAEVYK